MELVKVVVPVPLLVELPLGTVGFELVPQTTPLAVMAAPLDANPLPPLEAVILVMALMAVVVVTDGAATGTQLAVGAPVVR